MKIQKLFVTDLDGTFLRSDHGYDKLTLRKILDQFKERGYLFVAASGRSLLSLKEVFKEFEEDMAFLAENGSLLSYQGQMLFQDRLIKAEEYQPIVAAIQNSLFGQSDRILLSGIDKAFVSERVDEFFYQDILQYYPKVEKVRDLSLVKEDMIKIVANFPEEDLDEANRWLNDIFEGVTAVATGFDSVDIILSDIHKAVGLSHLCTYFDLSYQDVIAFGDNHNDLEMLEFAGLSLATANARDSVKAIADQVIGTCDEDAVLTYIQEYMQQ